MKPCPQCGATPRPNRTFCHSGCRNAWWSVHRQVPTARELPRRRGRHAAITADAAAFASVPLRRSDDARIGFSVPSHVTAKLRALEAAFVSDVLFNPGAFDLSDDFQWGMA